MEVNSLSKTAEVRMPQVENKSLPEKTVIKDMEPDSFEISTPQKKNYTEVALTVAGAGAFAAGIYKPAISFLTKGVEFVEKQAAEIAKTAAGGPKNIAKAGVIYGGAIAATVAAFGIAMQDKDGNGHVDLIDGLRKILNP